MYECADLSKAEIDRYGRQIIFSDFGIEGQISLRKSKVLIVGCGGLGCPAGIYLATAGVGCIGLVDNDIVEMSNLHRQVAHNESRVGVSKADSMKQTLQMLNSSIDIMVYNTQLTNKNAMDIFRSYDIVLDCTDNVPTRYLINDCAVLLKIPLVSASALGIYGQLTVYNYNGGPCYRCMYPKPPPQASVTNCDDGGVIGSIPGLLGVMQATETIKILCNIGIPLSAKLFNYSANDNSFNTFKLRSRVKTCAVCGDNPTITELIDYEQFCGMSANDACGKISLLTQEERISVQEYNDILERQEPHVLIDIRPEIQQRICKFTHAINIQMNDIERNVNELHIAIKSIKDISDTDEPVNVFIFCRRGNDSQIAVRTFKELLKKDNVVIKDIAGGMTAWAVNIKPDLPVY